MIPCIEKIEVDVEGPILLYHLYHYYDTQFDTCMHADVTGITAHACS